ncbi:ESPR-type extended signal peptide-containing protein [Salmonella enterica]
MNKIFKLVWNTKKRCYVITSELAVGQKKLLVSNRAIILSSAVSACFLLALGLVSFANATVVHSCVNSAARPDEPLGYEAKVSTNNTSNGTGTFSTVAGCGASGSNVSGATVYGSSALVKGDRGAAFGIGAQAEREGTAIGALSVAKAPSATSIGLASYAAGNHALAIGSNYLSKEGNYDPMSLIDSSKRLQANSLGSIAIGSDGDAGANIDEKSDRAIAIGTKTKVTASENSVAIGYGAVVSAKNSVSLGSNSVTDKENTVSVGSKGKERIVVNVAKGILNVDSTEAVNGAQLFAANQMVGKAVPDVKKSSILKLSDDGKKIVVNDTAKKATTLSLNNRKIEGVASGKVSASSTEAINGAQLYKTNRAVVNNTNRIGVLEGQVGELSGKVNGMEKQIHHNRKRASAGIAGAMAMSSIPHVYTNDFSFGMAAAAYDDQGAISAGFNVKLSENAAARVNYSLDTQNKMGVGVGFAFGF